MTVRFTHRQFMVDGTESTVLPIGSQAAKDAIERVRRRLHGGDRHPYATKPVAKVYVPRPCQFSGCVETIIGPGFRYCPTHSAVARQDSRKRRNGGR